MPFGIQGKIHRNLIQAARIGCKRLQEGRSKVLAPRGIQMTFYFSPQEITSALLGSLLDPCRLLLDPCRILLVGYLLDPASYVREEWFFLESPWWIPVDLSVDPKRLIPNWPHDHTHSQLIRNWTQTHITTHKYKQFNATPQSTATCLQPTRVISPSHVARQSLSAPQRSLQCVSHPPESNS